MAISWGPASGSGVGRHYVGIDTSVSGTTVTVKYYVRTQANSVADNQTLTLTGKYSGARTNTFYNSTCCMTARYVATRSWSGSRGATYTIGAKLTGVYSGSSPSHSVKVTVPAAAPARVGRPSISGVNSKGATVRWSRPAGNGATVTSFQVSLHTSSSGVGSLYGAGNSTTYRTQDRYANTTYYAKVRARNSAGWGGWSTAAKFTTNPARPAAPTGLTVTYLYDDSQALKWTRHSTNEAPYTSQRILRNEGYPTGGTSGYQAIATISGTATSYSDRTTKLNRRYDYKVEAVNSGGKAASSYASINTSPAAPANVRARKTGTNITVTWDNSPFDGTYGAKKIVIYDNPDGTGNVEVTPPGGLNEVESWVHLSPNPAQTHTYLVAARTTDPNIVQGGFAKSNTVQLQVPPLAPTIIAPQGPFIDRDKDVTFVWEHNTVDTSEQTGYVLDYRTGGSGSWTTLTGTTAQSRTVTISTDPGTPGPMLEWRIRTKGDDPSYGPWSPVQSVQFASQPSVAIQDPPNLTVLQTSELMVDWNYFDPDGGSQASWTIELVDGDTNVVETVQGSGTASSKVLDTILGDGTSWTVRVRARGGSGLWSDWDESTFTVEYPLPPPPVLNGQWQEPTGSIELSVENPDPGDLPGPVTNLVTNPRGRDTSGTVTLRENLAPNPYSGGSPNNSALNVMTENVPLSDHPLGITKGTSSKVAPGAVTTAIASSYNAGRTGRLTGELVYIGYWAKVDHDGYEAYSSGAGGSSVPLVKNEWLFYTFESPKEEWSGVAIRTVDASQVPENHTAWITGVVISTEPVAEYFDGDTVPDDPDLTAEWTGTAGASTSLLTAPVPVGWTIPNGNGYYSQSRDAIALTGPIGSRAYTYMNAIPATIVTTIETSDGNPVDMSIYRAEGVPAGSSTRTFESGTTQRWFHSSAGTSSAWAIQVREDMSDRTVYFRAGIIAGDYEGEWFDGHIEDTNAITYEFTGAEDASASTKAWVGAGAADVEYNNIWRSIDGGEWEQIATGVLSNGSFVDWTNAVVGENRYRATAWTGLPSTNESDILTIEIITRTHGCHPDPDLNYVDSVYVSGGEGFSQVCKASYSLDISTQKGRAGTVLHRFSGRTYPVEFGGTAREHSVDLGFETIPEPESKAGCVAATFDDWEDLTNIDGPHLYRDFMGRRFLASITPVNGKRLPRDHMDASITATRIVRIDGDGI